MRSTHSARMRVFRLSLAPLLSADLWGRNLRQTRQMTHAFTSFTIAPIYFYPAETTGITSFLFSHALHDASVKSMPTIHKPPARRILSRRAKTV